MKYIDASYEIWEQEPGIQGIFKQIEKAGRTCYKSEDKITENSAESFVQRMIDSKHTAMLEHGTVYLYFKHDVDSGIDTGDPFDVALNFTLNRYTAHRANYDTHESFYTTNLRVVVELLPNDWREFLEKHAVDYDERFERRITTKFTCNRQVSHEFVRHRVFSFAQESTRYCNYTKGKFGEELTFINPIWAKHDKSGHEQLTSALHYAENYYRFLIREGWKPQQAATVLPNALKTELVMTGTVEQWKHFFDLRAKGTTGAPHPQAKELAEPLMNEFISRQYIDVTYSNNSTTNSSNNTVEA